LIFPVCSKRCYKYVSSYNCKKEIVTSNSSTWEGDGSKDTKSSSEVLINWLTTEENSVNYFGGSDKDGRTSSTRKETYHNQLVDLIKQENGKYYSSTINFYSNNQHTLTHLLNLHKDPSVLLSQLEQRLIGLWNPLK
jgi:hypothetical protein